MDLIGIAALCFAAGCGIFCLRCTVYCLVPVILIVIAYISINDLTGGAPLFAVVAQDALSVIALSLGYMIVPLAIALWATRE